MLGGAVGRRCAVGAHGGNGTKAPVLNARMQRPRMAHAAQLAQFHSPEYVEFLSKVTPHNMNEYPEQLNLFNINSDDCPVFDGMYK